MAQQENQPPIITLYDIALSPPSSPNPLKSRLALNFKSLPHTTTLIPLPSIPQLRAQTLHLPPTRFFPDGTPHHTLPVLRDPLSSASSPALLGDSFDIAVHLQRRYPLAGAGDLFPPGGAPPYRYRDPRADREFLIPLSEVRSPPEYHDYAVFNQEVDALFTAHVSLMAYGLPFDPPSAEETKAEFVRRAGVDSWEDFKIVGEAREALKRSLEDALAPLAVFYRRDPSGPFILGQRATYADLIVGAWLRMTQNTWPDHEWQEARAWHGGLFGQLHHALDQYADVK